MLGISNFQYRRAFKKAIPEGTLFVFKQRTRVNGAQYEPSVGENIKIKINAEITPKKNEVSNPATKVLHF